MGGFVVGEVGELYRSWLPCLRTFSLGTSLTTPETTEGSPFFVCEGLDDCWILVLPREVSHQ